MVAPLVLGGLLLMGYLLIPKKEDTKIYNVSGKIKENKINKIVQDYIKSKNDIIKLPSGKKVRFTKNSDVENISKEGGLATNDTIQELKVYLKQKRKIKETHKERAIRERIEYPSKSGNANLKILLKDEKILKEKLQVNVLRHSKPSKWTISLQGIKSKHLKNYNLPEYEVTRKEGLAFKNKYKFTELKDQYGSYGYKGFMSLIDYLELKFD